MRIFVDADGCPVVDDILELTDDQEINIVHNRHHQINVNQDKVNTIETGDRPDDADHYIVNNLEQDDLVVTDDLGLGALVLQRDANVLRFRGEQLDPDTIEQRLEMRHFSAKARRDHGPQGGPSEFEDEDREQFRKAFQTVLHNTS